MLPRRADATVSLLVSAGLETVALRLSASLGAFGPKPSSASPCSAATALSRTGRLGA
ncbi:MAG TPA: hypothetical protein VG742_15870 [Dongiaceae bacterium]|nr:hypothetical protein [Dongiaceae bacterium]